MRPIGEEKVHSKLYKDGKLWVVMLIGFFLMGGTSSAHKVAAKSINETSQLAQRSRVNAALTRQQKKYLSNPVVSPITETGKAAEDPATQGTVDIKFVDDQGNQLAPDQTFSGKVDDPYTISPISIKDYQYAHLATNSAPASGTYTNGTVTVIMVYTKTPIPQGSVNVKYVDDAGNTLAPDKVLTGQPGDPYEARPIDIANYRFTSLAPGSAPENGTFSTGTLTVTFVYSKNPAAQGTVNVHYVDENGNTLAPDKVLTGNAGTPYTTAPTTIAGYQYLRMAPNSAADSGTFTNGTLNVTFVYAKTSTPVTPSTPTNPSTPNPPSNVLPSMGGNNGATTTIITPTNKAKHTLPRTHEEEQIGLTALGVVLLALAGFLGIRWRRRAKKVSHKN
ncbi:MucBP domain-containing protein [Lacticaseibacillus parahuelsenbergensis]|uniref:MucBP domain-containing protein n=1 Tax=Lacticaseibacillus parahuelsenbergensis TaxID=3068305 RepID=A0ABY9L1A9_9LACO|nr:MucBP domain-containing protein [Lacticaseibacillus sp. NCIMB 15471]WLV77423.1 MucBP domain-containing protein [Lacticaseibacillus sp. NCIMB 15471]